MITLEELKALLHYDLITGVFTNRTQRSRRIKIGSVAGCAHKDSRTSYIEIQINGRKYQAHRLAWLYVYGAWPEHQIDHIDGNGLNNSIGNLRDVMQSVNQRNRRANSNNTSGHPGVCWYEPRRKWRAYIMINGKQVHIGLFTTIEAAVSERLKSSHENGFIHR